MCLLVMADLVVEAVEAAEAAEGVVVVESLVRKFLRLNSIH